MKHSEVAQLLAVVATYEGRQFTPTDVAAFAMLPVVKNNSYEIGMAAVQMFYDKLPEDNGFTVRFSPQWLKYYIIKAKERADVEEARARARMTPEQRRALEEQQNRELESGLD